MVNRGVALYKGKVFVGAYDGRLVALDAATGKKVWEKDTIIDHEQSYTITGAPRVFKGKVIIGNGGAEYGVRGYVTAYDAETGEQAWRWFTVPGDPAKPFEDAVDGQGRQDLGPGRQVLGGRRRRHGVGHAWPSIPTSTSIYVGTGNGSPWARSKRSPAGGDNLYLSSIVALNADTGKYVWHYQETPGDNWDYTATQPMILADLTIDGAAAQGDPARAEERLLLRHRPHQRQVHLGEELRRRELGHRLRRERPADRDAARRARRTSRATSFPARSARTTGTRCRSIPQTGLVYMPAQNMPLTLMDNKDWKLNGNKPGEPHSGLGWNTGDVRQRRAAQEQAVRPPDRVGSGEAEGGLGVRSTCRRGTAAR